MTTRPLITVWDPKTGNATSNKVTMPAVFTAPIRLDVVEFVHTNIRKNRRQAHGVDPQAGMKHSAESWGTGRAVARIPRVGGSGTHRSGQAAFGNMCRKGRMFAPLHIWRRWHRRVNIKQKRAAVAAAIAASGLVPLVQARGHQISKIPELPLVVDNSLEQFAHTKQAVEFLQKIGAYEEVKRVINSKKLRAGKGKLRNKRYQQKRGPLVVYGGEEGTTIRRAFRNVPGVDVLHVNRLNLLLLAPGGQVGRFVIWTQSAFEQLNTVFGTYSKKGQQKGGYNLPRAILTNPDIARIINSNEVQSAINASKEDVVLHTRKTNPLKNKKAMDWLNPFAKIQREQARKQQEVATQKRQEALKQKRSSLTAAQKKDKRQRKKDSKQWFKTLSQLQREADERAIAEEEQFKVRVQEDEGEQEDVPVQEE